MKCKLQWPKLKYADWNNQIFQTKVLQSKQTKTTFVKHNLRKKKKSLNLSFKKIYFIYLSKHTDIFAYIKRNNIDLIKSNI